MKDLFVLVADEDMRQTMMALLQRHESLHIRPIAFEVERHLKRDAGCRADASRLLRPRLDQYHKAIVMLDKHGCGREDVARDAIQQEIEQGLAASGWADRARAVAIEPELEAWVWASSNNVTKVLGWPKGYDDLKAWLMRHDLWLEEETKPSDPKAALKAVLRNTKRAHSASLFGELAKRTTWRYCQCPAFAELKHHLQRWFG